MLFLVIVVRHSTRQRVFNITATFSGTNAPYTKTQVYTKAEVDTALALKQNNITSGATSILTNTLTINRAVISDGAGRVAVSSTISSTELGYLDGVTSNIQTQLNNITVSGDLNYGFVSTKYAGYVNSAGTVLGTYGKHDFTVTVNGTGDYTINFTVALPNTYYVIHGSADTGDNECSFSVHTRSLASCRVIIRKTRYHLHQRGAFN